MVLLQSAMDLVRERLTGDPLSLEGGSRTSDLMNSSPFQRTDQASCSTVVQHIWHG